MNAYVNTYFQKMDNRSGVSVNKHTKIHNLRHVYFSLNEIETQIENDNTQQVLEEVREFGSIMFIYHMFE